MNSHPEKNSSKRPRQWFFAVLTALLALLVCLGVSNLRKKRENAEIAQKLQAIRAQGLPVTEEELKRFFPPPPPEKDFDILMKDSFSPFRLSNAPRHAASYHPKSLPRGTNRFSASDEKKVKQSLEEMKSALDSLPRPWPSDVRIALPKRPLLEFPSYPLSPLHFASSTLLLKIFSHAQNGEGDQAVELLALAIELNRSLQGPMYHSVGRAREKGTMRGLEPILNHALLNEDQWLKLQKLFEEEGSAGLYSAKIFERCRGIELFESLKKVSFVSSIPKDLAGVKYYSRRLIGRVPPLVTHHDYLEFLEITEDYLNAAESLDEGRWEKMIALENRLLRKDASTAWLITGNYWEGKTKREMEAVSRLRLGQTAIAIERYRLKHGKIPLTLDNLIPEFLPRVPIDPFNAQSLKFKPTAPGYIVYSVGPDKEDNDGLDKDDKPATKEWDITIQVGR